MTASPVASSTTWHLRPVFWLTRIARHRLVVTFVLLAMGVTSAILGFWGWRLYGDDHPERNIDTLAALYGTAGLFAFISDVSSAPGPLVVARLTAPLTTLGVVLSAVLTFAETRIQRFAAGHTSGHRVLIGSSLRLDAYLGSSPGAVIHFDTDESGVPVGSDRVDPPTEVMYAAIDLERSSWRTDAWDHPTRVRRFANWVTASNATRAEEVVIATGRDDLNMAALGHALQHLDPSGHTSVRVEIDDRSAALRLAVSMAQRDDPRYACVGALCRSDIVARAAAEQLHKHLEHDEGVVVVGDGEMAPLFAMHVPDVLMRSYRAGQADKPLPFAVVDAGPGRLERVRSTLAGVSQLDTTIGGTVSDLLSSPEWANRSVVAFVDGGDRSSSYRDALELVTGFGVRLVFAPLGDLALAFDEIRSVDGRAALKAGDLVGPLQRASLLGPLPPGASDADVPELLMKLVRHLDECDFKVVPRMHPGHGMVVIPKRAWHDRDDPDDLVGRAPAILAQVGLAVVRRDELP